MADNEFVDSDGFVWADTPGFEWDGPPDGITQGRVVGISGVSTGGRIAISIAAGQPNIESLSLELSVRTRTGAITMKAMVAEIIGGVSSAPFAIGIKMGVVTGDARTGACNG